jgi:hypothetical protein
MNAVMQFPLAELLQLDVPGIFAGHTGYETGLPPREGGGGDEGGGIGTAPIVAVLALALVTVGLFAWLDPSGTRAKVKKFAPLGLIALIIAGPLVVWAASSGGGQEENLIVERATGRTGEPEFIFSLADKKLNTLQTTNGKGTVRVQCRTRDGRVVLDARQKWPFIEERGWDYPHVHQPAEPEQVHRADHCRLRGTRVSFEADVQGALTG